MATLLGLLFSFLFAHKDADASGSEYDYDERDVSGW